MKVDLEEARKILKFNEINLVDASETLLEAYKNGRNIFSEVKESCDSLLPEGVVKGSLEHARYIFLTTVVDVATDSNILYEKARKVFKEKPEVFDPSHVFNTDKDKLKIVKTKRSKVLVAPTMTKILKEDFGHGLCAQLSGRYYETCRKLCLRYGDDPREPFKYVTDPLVGLRRLDVGTPLQPVEKEVQNTSLPRFSFGWKTGPFLEKKYILAGFIKGMDVSELYQPFDTHLFGFSIGRGATNIDNEIRKERFTRYAQELFRKTFRENKIDNIEFQTAEWILGSEVCGYSDCHDRKAKNGERACPFENSCKKYLDSHNYKTRGFISPLLENLSY